MTYQMQAWKDDGNGRTWTPMEHGVAPRHWRPTLTPEAAVRHAATWSGAFCGIGIPAMQVVNLATGTVIWRSSTQYPDAGPPIAPPWQEQLYAAIRAEALAQAHEAPPTPIQGTLL